MKDLVNKLPDSNVFFEFLKTYYDQIEELYDSIVKFFKSLDK